MDQEAGYRWARAVTAGVAVLLGALLISNLWVVTLTEETLFAAARGVVLLLIALGLMGEHRLSLGLSAIICAPAVIDFGDNQPSALLANLEFLLFCSSTSLLCWATYLKHRQ